MYRLVKPFEKRDTNSFFVCGPKFVLFANISRMSVVFQMWRIFTGCPTLLFLFSPKSRGAYGIVKAATYVGIRNRVGRAKLARTQNVEKKSLKRVYLPSELLHLWPSTRSLFPVYSVSRINRSFLGTRTEQLKWTAICEMRGCLKMRDKEIKKT